MRPAARNLTEGKVAARCGARAARIPAGRKWSTWASWGTWIRRQATAGGHALMNSSTYHRVLPQSRP